MNTEHIDIGLARYSDWAFTSSVVVLVIAMLFLAFELAYARSRKVAERELVAAGTVSADSATPGLVVEPRSVRSTSASGGPGWSWSTQASGFCWCASCFVAWRPRGCRGATCTSSST